MLGICIARTVISVIPPIYWMYNKPAASNDADIKVFALTLLVAVGSLISLVT